MNASRSVLLICYFIFATCWAPGVLAQDESTLEPRDWSDESKASWVVSRGSQDEWTVLTAESRGSSAESTVETVESWAVFDPQMTACLRSVSIRLCLSCPTTRSRFV